MPAAQGWVPRLPAAPGPIYLAIADAIDAAMASGELPQGARLPTHRALAQALGVDLTTVTRAYAEARRRGLVQGTVGRGTFVQAAPPGPEAPPVVASPGPAEGPVDLGMNLPPLPEGVPLTEWMQRDIAALLAGPEAAGLLTYRTGAGAPAERAAGAAWLAPTLGRFDPHRLLVCPGAQPGLMAVLATLIPPGAPPGAVVLTDALTYPGLRGVAARLGLALQAVPADSEGMLPEALAAACRGPARPVAVYCVPTMHNPTTLTMPTARRRALAKVIRAAGPWLVEDDAYGLLPAEPLPAIASFVPERAFHLATLSKVLTPALRVAFLVAPAGHDTAALLAALRANVLMASPLLTALAALWIADGAAARILAGIRRESAARQRIAQEVLPPGTIQAEPDSLHLWLRLPARWDRLDFAAHLRREGLAVVPADAFAIGPAVPQAVRLSLGAAPGRAALRGALGTVAAALRSQAPSRFTDIV